MSNRAKRRQHRQSAQNRNPKVATFTPVPVRTRMDGWTPDRQVAFVTALAATACIEDACGAVGMSPRSYYDLRARPGSDSFRQAVEAVLDVGTHRLETALLGRAIHGEATPIFYKGEQVGERRRYDNRLGLTLLRARAADRYGAWRDRVPQVREHPDGAALLLKEATRRLAEDGRADLAGRRRPTRAPLRSMILADPDEAEPDEADRTGSAAWCKRYGFDPDLGWNQKDENDEEAEEDWGEDEWLAGRPDHAPDDDAYVEELLAQTAPIIEPVPPTPAAPPAPVADPAPVLRPAPIVPPAPNLTSAPAAEPVRPGGVRHPPRVRTVYDSRVDGG